MLSVQAPPRASADPPPFPAPNCRPWCRHDHLATAADDANIGMTLCEAEKVNLPLQMVEDVPSSRRIVVAVSQVWETDGTTFEPTVTLLGDSYDEPITPADARRLGAELIRAADIAEQAPEVTR